MRKSIPEILVFVHNLSSLRSVVAKTITLEHNVRSIMANSKETKPFDFEASLARLEDIADQMEKNQFKMDELVSNYKEGIELLVRCRSFLTSSELLIKNAMNELGPVETDVDSLAD